MAESVRHERGFATRSRASRRRARAAGDREDLRQGPVARESRRAAIVPDDRGAADRDRPAHARRADRARCLRVRADAHRHRASQRQDGVPDRGRAGRHFRHSRRAARAAAARPRHSLSRRALSRMRARRSPTRRCAPAFRLFTWRRSISRRSISSSSRKPRPARRPSRTDARARVHPESNPLVAARALLVALALPVVAGAADFRSTRNPATVLYDAPSAHAKPLFVYGRDVPVESLVSVEGWTKIRDASGTIGWMQNPSLSDKRMLVVRAPAPTSAQRPRKARRSCSAPIATCCSSSPSRPHRRPRRQHPGGSRCATATARRVTCALRRFSGSRMNDPHARVARCPQRGRVSPSGRPFETEMKRPPRSRRSLPPKGARQSLGTALRD